MDRSIRIGMTGFPARLRRHFLIWIAVVVGTPLTCVLLFVAFGPDDPFPLLALLPLLFLFVPPALLFGEPHFRFTEVMVYPESWLGFALAGAFWLVVCALLAGTTAFVVSAYLSRSRT